jgi:predicted transposase/invertase (TIGR01784 family)
MGKLLDGIRGLCEQGMLTEGDEELMLGEIELLYTKLYEPYEGFREVKTMVDERILTRFDKLRMEIATKTAEVAAAEAKMAATRTETRTEVARNLLKAGVAKDIILQATGLTAADI